jgi:uncharacterized integral membrane protein (TIGR00698 family)
MSATATHIAPAAELNAFERWVLGTKLRQAPILLPGIALALLVALAANFVGDTLGAGILRLQGVDPTGKASPISGIAMAVVLGLIVANTIGVRPLFAPGLDFTMKKLLRLGIILVGIKLSIIDVLKVGGLGIPVVVGVVTFGLVVTLALAKWAGLSPKLGTLAAASTAICGITATVAIAPAIKADDREVAYTVANVTLFGLIAMLAYPYLAHALFADHPGAAGLFLGTAIHETSQVMGAALSYKEVFDSERAAQVATVAKLTRNALLVAVVPVLAWLHARRAADQGAKKMSLASLFPVFVLGFLALALVRSIGDLGARDGGLAYGLFDSATWSASAKFVGEKAAGLLLGTALAGVGLTTTMKVFKGLGIRPLLIGFAAAFTVGLAALALAALVGPMLG